MKTKNISYDKKCPLCGEQGKVGRIKLGSELYNLYESYYTIPLSDEFYKKYFSQQVIEFDCVECGLRWYEPGLLGDGSYYKSLQETYSWYYNPSSWDKIKCIDVILNLKSDWVLEVGCGDGWLLGKLKKHDIKVLGIEINPLSVEHAIASGLDVRLPSNLPERPNGKGTLCLLQTIEHLDDPLGLIIQYIEHYDPEFIILSAPCSQSLLGHTNDPLSWPPHHYTAWSDKSMRKLAEKIGYELNSVQYSPLGYNELEQRFYMERSRKLHKLPRIPNGLIGKITLKLARYLKVKSLTRGHSILCILSKRIHN